jgi:hypothetical protein
MTSEKINDGGFTIHRVEPLLALFVCLVSLRAEIRARKDTRAAYSAALVDAIAAEDSSDDWSELEAMHRAQRRGTAKHGLQR